jgi:hypothetical protein
MTSHSLTLIRQEGTHTCANGKRHDIAVAWANSPTVKGRFQRKLCEECAEKFARIHRVEMPELRRVTA